MSADGIVHIEGANWETEVVKSATPVLVDFWAEWCGPCRALAPVLDELATELKGKIKIAKVDVDKNPQLAGTFGIRSIPTLLVMKGGTVQEQMVGALSKAALLAKLKTYVA
jgi:thioredoxin 1